MINRRDAIQQLLLIWAGVSLLPSCLHHEEKVSIPLRSFIATKDDENMLSELTETILPKTDTPGAKDIMANLFVLKMVDDCYKKTDQQKFIEGMKAFESYSEKKNGKTFTESSAVKKNAIIAELDKQKPDDSDLSFFYHATKNLTIEAYTTCEYYMTKIRGYKMLPGKFQGCVPLKTA